MKDFLSTQNLVFDDFLSLIDLAKHFKILGRSANRHENILQNKSIVHAFFENSTRTRISFELAAKRLGADSTALSPNISSAAKGESLLDTIKNLQSMQNDFFVIRHSASGAANFIAQNTNAHVINAGDGCNEHPTQAMLDLFTICENFNENTKLGLEAIKNKNISIIGDIFHSRVARSNIYALKTLGANITLFGPPQCLRNAEIFECQIAKNMQEAIEFADIIIMLRIQLERSTNEVALPNEYAKFFGLNNAKFIKNSALILHPGPVNRGIEMSGDILDNKSSVLQQVENGVAMRMAIFTWLYKNFKG